MKGVDGRIESGHDEVSEVVDAGIRGRDFVSPLG
jgi:hypothetical protein